MGCLQVQGQLSQIAQTNEMLNPSTDSFTCGTLKMIDTSFSFTEGPASDKAGNVYFTDQPNNQIWKYDTKGNLSVYLSPAGRANGMYIDRKGHLIVCADEHNQLWTIDKRKKITILLKGYQGKLFNGPNDAWVDAKGGIYFTDPYYQRDYWTRTSPEQDTAAIYYLPKGADKAIRISNHLVKPNGLVGSADGKLLYVADINDRKIYRFRIVDAGVLKDPAVFINQIADGITTDRNGNVYLSGNGVTVFNANGKKLHHIPVNQPWVSNLSFGGKRHRFLFITASKGIYILPTNQQGVKR